MSKTDTRQQRLDDADLDRASGGFNISVLLTRVQQRAAEEAANDLSASARRQRAAQEKRKAVSSTARLFG